MSEKKPPSTTKEKTAANATPQPESSVATSTSGGAKCLKRKLFAASSPPHGHQDDDERRFTTPIKQRRKLPAGLESPQSVSGGSCVKSSCASSASCATTPTSSSSVSSQNRLTSVHNVPLSERQQLAMILKMTDNNSQADVSPKPSSPVHVPQRRTTPAEKKVNKRNERGETILHLVAIKGDAKQTKRYIKAGADVNATDFAGWTALHEACNHGWIDIAKLLLKAGGNVNAQGLDNDTPLHDASGNGHTKLVELLLKHGADPRQVNRKGKSAVDVAASDEIVQLLKKEIISSNSECSSADEVRSPTSPESASSTRDDDHNTAIDDFSARVSSQMAPRTEASLAEPFKKHSVAKSPDNKSHSPRLFLKFQHIKFKDGQSCDSSEAAAEDPQQYKSYSVTLETSDRSSDCFSPFNSASSNESDSYESKLDIGRRLKAVDASLTEQDDLLMDSDARFYSGDSSYVSSNSQLKPHTSEVSSAQYIASLPDTSRSRTFEGAFPPLLIESTTAESTTSQSTYRPFSDDCQIPSLQSKAMTQLTVSSSTIKEKTSYAPTQISDANVSMAVISNNSAVGTTSSQIEADETVKTSVANASILCERTGERVPVSNANNSDAFYLSRQTADSLSDDSSYYDANTSAYKTPDCDPDRESNSKNVAPKVPPLKIIMPTKTSTLPRDTDNVNCSVSKMSLPYVVNSATVDNEATSTSVFNLSVSMFSSCVSESVDSARTTDEDVATSSTDLDTFATAVTAPESTYMEDAKPTSENETSEESTDAKEEKDERRITRSLRSQMAQLQQKQESPSPLTNKRTVAASDQNEVNSDSGKLSRADDMTGVDEASSTDMPPRKRKLRPKPESIVAEIPPPNPMSLYELPPNPYQIYLSLKRTMLSRQEGLLVVPPKEPQGFKDYLMVSCGYVLQGNTASTLAVPMLSPPNSVTGAMRDLFSQQEKARYKLRLQHLVEREKLTLASEQEVLRVHGRAARAMANQSLPLSVCTVLKDEDLYPTTDFDQMDERDKNIRSRYNGRQFLSWLQDVADKYDKLKELLILRHHHEAESLYAVQKMDWEWKMKALGICEYNVTPKIDDLHVPMVQVNDE